MKIHIKILLFFTFLLGIFLIEPSFAAPDNLNINVKPAWSHSNGLLNNFKSSSDLWIWNTWERWVYELLIRIARDLKNLFYFIATIYFFIIVFKLLASWKSEEELWNFKKWIIWISIWLAIMQMSYSFVKVLFDRWVGEHLGDNLVEQIIVPVIGILETWASFFFIAMAIYSFYRLITANWNEEAVKSWKMTIVYSIIWYIIIKFSKILVESIYWRLNCTWIPWLSCIDSKPDAEWFSWILATIINWANWFIGLITILMVIYAWYYLLFSWWNEEMVKKAKSTIIYVAIGLFLLVTNYIILTFFLIPNNAI